MKNSELYKELVNSKFDKLDLMINEYNSLDCDEIMRKYEYFLKCLSYVIQLEEDNMIVKIKNKKYKISYLKTILDNDGPEYALTIGFNNPYNSKVIYEIGVCVRGTPLLKKT
ncbi:MAG: hypothetical protein IKK46_08450 [Clostridia bacterium]|nr:hypothetical protein [Oscillospiraceae bacterium]MBR3810313.1 hypothetical protein [Clostridia bacterium]